MPLPSEAQSRRRWVRRTIAIGLLACLVSPPAALGESLGTVRSTGGAETSFDGRVWVPLRDTPMPVLNGTEIRTSTGVALLDLAAGAVVNLLPYTAARVQVRESVTEVLFRCGRLTFRLPDPDRLAILTPAARLEPAREGVAVGEVFSDRTGTTGLKVLQGVMRVQAPSVPRRVVSPGTGPAFVPRRPAVGDPLFISDMTVQGAPGPKVVFTPDGKSFGYLRADGQPMVEPGVSADLTGPFPERLVQAARASAPAGQRERYLPLFDVNGKHVGGIVGGQDCAEFIAGPATGPQALVLLPGLAALGIPVVGVGVSALAFGGVGKRPASGGGAATPLEPRRSP